MNEIRFPFNARYTFTLLALILTVYIAHMASEILVPLILATLIAIMLLPLASLLEKWRFSRGIAAFTAVLIFIVALLVLLTLLTQQMMAFLSDIPHLQKQLLSTVDTLQIWINQRFHIDSSTQMDYLEKAALGTLGTATGFISQTFLSISSLLIFVVFVLLYSFFILYYRQLFMTFLLRLFPGKHQQKLQDIVGQTRFIIKSYVGGLMIEMVVVALLNCTIFWIMGIKYATLLGVMAAIFNIIPYIGIFTAIVLSMLVTLTTGTPVTALQVGIALFLVHLLDSNVLLPRIVGSKVKINALVTLISVVLGNMLWGIPGMFLAIPIIAIIKIIFERIEPLQPWALLLGDLEDTGKKKKTPFPRKQ